MSIRSGELVLFMGALRTLESAAQAVERKSDADTRKRLIEARDDAKMRFDRYMIEIDDIAYIRI